MTEDISVAGIQLIDPVTRLQVLQKYMAYWVDHYPRCIYSFEGFIQKKYRYLIPGTVDHAKRIATHCYYCNRQFTTDKSFMVSVDHYLPQSEGQTDKYVICCVDCNSRKSNIMPDDLVSKMTNAALKGRSDPENNQRYAL